LGISFSHGEEGFKRLTKEIDFDIKLLIL